MCPCPVHDARPLGVESARLGGVARHEPGGHAGAGVPGSAVYGQARWLIDGDDVVILVDDGQVSDGRRRRVRSFGDLNAQPVPGRDAEGLQRGHAVHADVAAGNKTLQARPAQVGTRCGKHRVQPAGCRGYEFASVDSEAPWKSIAHISKSTPMEIAESATLNAGQ